MNKAMEAARDAAYLTAFGKSTDPRDLANKMFDAGWNARGSQWVAVKPDYACVFVGKRGDDYSLWEFVWVQSEGSDFEAEDFQETENTIHYCLAWCDKDGDEYDDIEECNFDEYLVIAKRPTMDEVHAETVERIKKRYERELLVPYKPYTADSGQEV